MRYQKSQNAENKILDATLKAVNENTIGGMRMHQVAQNARMVQSNIHYYYNTKDALMRALQEKVLEECRLLYAAAQDTPRVSPPEDVVKQIFDRKKSRMRERGAYDFAELNFLIQSKGDAATRLRFGQIYDEWLREMRERLAAVRPDFEEAQLQALPSVLISMLHGATLQAIMQPEQFDPDAYFDLCAKIIVQSIRSAGER